MRLTINLKETLTPPHHFNISLYINSFGILIHNLRIILLTLALKPVSGVYLFDTLMIIS